MDALKDKTRIIAAIEISPDRICVSIGSASISAEKSDLEVLGIGMDRGETIGESGVKSLDGLAKAVHNALKKAEDEAGVSIYKADVSVSGCGLLAHKTRGIVRIGKRASEIRRRDVRRVLEAARRTSLPFDSEIVDVIPQSFTIDDQRGVADPLGLFGQKLEAEVLVISAPASYIHNIRKALNMSGIELDKVVYSGIAGFYGLRRCPPADGPDILHLDVCRQYAELSLFRNGRLNDFVVIARNASKAYLPPGVTDTIRNWTMTSDAVEMALLGSESLREGMVEHVEAVTAQSVRMASLKGIRGKARCLNNPVCITSVGCLLYRSDRMAAAGRDIREAAHPVKRAVRYFHEILDEYF